jgi:hypothetical protein
MVRIEYSQNFATAQSLLWVQDEAVFGLGFVRLFRKFWRACFSTNLFSFLASSTLKFNSLLYNQSRIVSFGWLLRGAGVYNNVKNNVNRCSPRRRNSRGCTCGE